jgi:hypothetical protein
MKRIVAAGRSVSSYLGLCLFVGVVSMAGVGCGAMEVVATTPRPNVIPSRTLSGTVTTDISGVSDDALCSLQGQVKYLCVSQLKRSLDSGLKVLLWGYVKGGEGPAYRGVFRMVELTHSPTSAGDTTTTLQIMMRWQFELLDGERKVVQIAQTTVGPQQIAQRQDADKAVDALLNAVLESISSALNQATWDPPAGAPAAVVGAPGGG